MKNTINILGVKEQNAFVNPAKANNGGGYEQPEYAFEYKGVEGTYSDTSCGEFGTRYEVKWNGYSAYFGSMLSEREHYYWSGPTEFADAFRHTFGVELPLKEVEA